MSLLQCFAVRRLLLRRHLGLSPAERLRLEHHVQECSDCDAHAAVHRWMSEAWTAHPASPGASDVRALDRAVRRALAPGQASGQAALPLSRGAWRRPWPQAAVVLLVLLIGGTSVLARRGGRRGFLPGAPPSSAEEAGASPLAVAPSDGPSQLTARGSAEEHADPLPQANALRDEHRVERAVVAGRGASSLLGSDRVDSRQTAGSSARLRTGASAGLPHSASTAELLADARRALSERRVGDARQQIAAARALSRTDPERAQCAMLLADCAHAEGKPGLAYELYREVSDQYPSTMTGQVALFAAARSLLAQGERARAYMTLQEYLARYPEGAFQKEVRERLSRMTAP